MKNLISTRLTSWALFRWDLILQWCISTKGRFLCFLHLQHDTSFIHLILPQLFYLCFLSSHMFVQITHLPRRQRMMLCLSFTVKHLTRTSLPSTNESIPCKEKWDSAPHNSSHAYMTACHICNFFASQTFTNLFPSSLWNSLDWICISFGSNKVLDHQSWPVRYGTLSPFPPLALIL